MRIGKFIGAAFALACSLALAVPLGADDKTVLIELDLRSGLLPNTVSAAGTMVVGNLDFTGASAYWMPTSGTIYIGGLFGRGSRDGRTIVGSALDSRGIQQAGIWLRGTEWRLLGSFTPSAAPCDTSLSLGRGTSADGRVVVGFARNGCTVGHAFRWEEATGMVDLGSSVAGHESYATGVSGDGKVVVGYQERTDSFLQGARWVDGRQELIPGAPGVPERPLLNHIGVLVDSVDEHQAEAEELGVEIDDLVDAPNTLALFVWGPDRVKLEYVEHKPSFSLT